MAKEQKNSDKESLDEDKDQEALPEVAPEHAVEPVSKLKGKKFIIIGGIILALALIGGGVFYYLKNKSSTNIASGDPSDKSATAKNTTVYYDMDEFLVNLDKGDKQPNFLKMVVSLQLSSADEAEKVKLKMAIIRDAFQVYLRELRVDDLQGSAGLYRLREELMLRISRIMAPDKVDDILFKEILVQ